MPPTLTLPPGPKKHRHTLRKLGTWLPLHWLLASLVALNGYLLLEPAIDAARTLQGRVSHWHQWVSLDSLNHFLNAFGLIEVPRLMLGAGLQIMAIGLFFRARIAWSFSVVLLLGSGLFFILRTQGHELLALYTFALSIVLLLDWRRFNRSSLIAGSLFALISVILLLVYAIFGSLYLGAEFKPQITDGATAFYFSIVAMSTVGFGDITPQTEASRLFTTSVIVLGVTVFATSVSAIAGPLFSGNLKRLVSGKLNKTMRKNHVIIAGVTPLAQSVYQALHEKEHEITVIIPTSSPNPYPQNADVLPGDPTDTDTLRLAGAEKARYILALGADDAENAFIVLASREVKGADTKTVVLVNLATHQNKMRQVAPDLLISLQSLGTELLARTISGEPIDNATITHLLFAEPTQP
ncbi:MAG: voltage-gated potassium channel protein [Alcaligenaceae bacterium]|nr:voltage-gated potassium channel protein [Alcaligenaceae bacterium]